MKKYWVYQDRNGFWRCERDASEAFGKGMRMAVGTVYEDQAHAENAAMADAGKPIKLILAVPPC